MTFLSCRNHEKRIEDLERQVKLCMESLVTVAGYAKDTNQELEGMKVPPMPDLSPEYFR